MDELPEDPAFHPERRINRITELEQTVSLLNKKIEFLSSRITSLQEQHRSLESLVKGYIFPAL